MSLDIQRKVLVYLPEDDYVYAEVRETDEPVKTYSGEGLLGCMAPFKDVAPIQIDGFEDYPELNGMKFRRLDEHPDYEAIQLNGVKVDVRIDMDKGEAKVASLLLGTNEKLLTSIRFQCIVRLTAEYSTGGLKHRNRRNNYLKAGSREMFGDTRPHKLKLRPKPHPALEAKPNPLALAIRRERYRD